MLRQREVRENENMECENTALQFRKFSTENKITHTHTHTFSIPEGNIKQGLKRYEFKE